MRGAQEWFELERCKQRGRESCWESGSGVGMGDSKKAEGERVRVVDDAVGWERG
jgi:hypothetical protein